MTNTPDFSPLFYFSPFPTWIFEEKTYQILDVNQTAIDHYGYSKEEFLALTIKDLSPKETSNILAPPDGADSLEGNINFGTFTHQKKSGEIIRVEINGHKINFQGKNCIMAVCQDVTAIEKQFRQSQEAIHIMNASMDVICSIDENGKFLTVSNASLLVWGYQPEDLMGRAYLELVYEDDRVLTEQAAKDIMSGKSMTTFENRYLKKNGDVAYNIWSARWDPATKVMYAIARDATEKRNADEAIAESENRFKVLVQEGSDLIAIMDEAGNYKYVSPTSLAVLGYTPEDFIGKSPFEFIHPDDFEKAMQSLGKIAKENLVTIEPFRFKNKDGEWRWIETVLTNMIANPAIQGIVANSRDITNQKNEEQHLKLLQSVITHTNDAVLITEAESQDEPGPRIIYVNEAFTRMTGYSAEEVIGKSPRLLQGPKSDKKELARLGKALRNWESCEITTVNYKKNGEAFWINITVSPVADEKGRYTHWIAIERDVTASKNEQFQKEFSANISAVFNDGIDLNMSLERLCQLIVNYGNFSFCEIWLPTIHQKNLKISSRVEMDDAAKEFYLLTHDLEEIGFDKGLPGKVWKSKESIIWEEIDKNGSFVRKNAAQKVGLKSVLGIPLIHQDNIVGVMVAGTKEDAGKLKQHQSILTKMESFIGSEINRKRLESEMYHLFDTLPDIICLADLNGHFLKINKAGCELLGYEEQEIVGNPFEKYTHPLDKAVFARESEKVKKGETIFSFENRYLTKNDDVIWLSWHCNFIIEEGVIYATAKNITEDKKLRELVADASQLAKIGSWELELLSQDETDIMYWSPMVKKILEVDDDYDPSFSGGLEFYKDESKAILEKAVETLINDGNEFDEELQIVTKTGKEKWIRCIGKRQQGQGKCTKIFGSFQDIDSMKTTQIQLKEILGSISDAFYALDDQWNFTYFNKEAENLLHRKNSEMLGKNIWEEFVPAVGTELETVYRKVAKTGKPISFEYLYPGDESWYELNVYPFSGGVSSYFKNIDERKKAALEIQKAFEEKNKILESIGDAFFALDKNWTVTYWNKEAEHVLGRNREEILGKNLWEVYADAVELDFYKQYHKAMASRTTVTFEELYPTLKKWFEVTAYPSDEGLSVYFKDITLRKETDIRILQANERFEKVTKATTDAIWDWDLEKDILYRGEGFEKLFGYERNEKFQEDDFWNDKYHPKDLPEIKSSLDETINDPTQAFWKKEYRIIHQSGEIKTVIAKGVVIRDQKGKAMRMVGAISDISERIKYENELQELNKILKKNIKELQISNEQLEQFAFIASHDLQEPLRMISSFLNQIERKYRDQLDDKAHQYIHFATDGAKRMKQIILDLLQYSRAGKLADTPETINLNEPIQEYRVLRRRLIEEKRATIIADNLPNLKCFKVPLVQTLHCLLDNAIKYSRDEEPPVIKISALETETYWQISIEDNGIGIDSQFFDKVFIIFQRLHNRDKYGGTGIGLSIAKKNIEFWGGRIWIESELEKGTIFYFTIDKNIEI